jgi:Putative transposase
MEDRRSELLDTQYFHVVFTVPQPIAAIALQNKETVYNILFRATAETLRTIAADSKHLGAPIRKKDWVVYAKPPFAGPEEVLKYVARYTHRAAISNNRLRDIDEGKVQFRWKVYRDDNRHKTMTLGADEFIRRFLLHVLPDGFQRIRYFGFLANRYRAEKLALCRQLMQMPPPATTPEVNKDYKDRYEALTGISLRNAHIMRSGHCLATGLGAVWEPLVPRLAQQQ